MKLTYIGHSCFAMEWDEVTWLFDYYRGDLSFISNKKPIQSTPQSWIMNMPCQS